MKINQIIIATACTLSAAFGIASIQHRRVHADGNRAGGSGERSGAEGRLGVSQDLRLRGSSLLLMRRFDGSEVFLRGCSRRVALSDPMHGHVTRSVSS